ncbi:MAG TPA: HEAT repeat domain-containing protein [Vicinamibacterales bacterium]|nr:HEAT repeat domain-containing protein [Vicinamibacterales bacterium]
MTFANFNLRTRTTIAVMTGVALAGFAGLAQAQIPVPPAAPAAPVVAPAPPAWPAPQVGSMPRPVPAPRAPRMLDLEPIALDLDQIRLNLDDLRVTMPALPPIPMLAPMPVIDTQLLRETTRDAVEHARIAMDDARMSMQQSYVYTDGRSSSGEYNACRDYVNRKQYEQALVRCDRVIAQKGNNVDGALYWKAFAQYRLGKTEDSIATIAVLRKEHGSSPYMQDAKVLEADARRMTGKPVNPADADDEELKALAIQGLMRQDAARGVEAAESQLGKTNSLSFKRKLLYSLATSDQPRAYQILLGFAKGGGNPDLQLEAIQYLAANRNKQQSTASSKDLMDIYQSTSNTDVKIAIINALRASGNQSALTQIIGQTSTPVAIRASALNGLAGVMSPQDLWTLYEKENEKELRMQMISAFGSMQAMDQLNRVIKSEKDPEVRRRALRSLGNMRSEKTGQMLVDLYGSETDLEAKKSIISSLTNQNNAEGLVAIARKESSLPLKTEIVRKLADMAPKNKVAADYLMEIIKSGI